MQKNEKIGRYKILFSIAKGRFSQTYRVKDEKNKTYFLKLIDIAKVESTQFNEDNEIIELGISKELQHPNITSYSDSGEIIIKNNKYLYIVYKFIGGETVLQKFAREQYCSVYDAKQIVLGVLDGLKYMHSRVNPIIHRNITMGNVMLDLSKANIFPIIIGFGSSIYLNDKNILKAKEDINPYYLAPEALNGSYSKQSDIFSVGAMLYHLIFGFPPYFDELSGSFFDDDDVNDYLIEERQKPLKILDIDEFEFDENLANVISKAIALKAEERFQSVDEFIKALQGENSAKPLISKNDSKGSKLDTRKTKSNCNKVVKGFAAIAGMDELKSQIKSDVIDMLQHPEEYKRHQLNLPNGMLLYGPPGCGKTFFAEKLAEEVGFNFYQINPADIQSKWVNASQENVKKLFTEAIEKAPSIIFIDRSLKYEVRQFLNCSEISEFRYGILPQKTLLAS